MRSALLVLAGAVVGGVLGYFLFVWCLGQGFYALALPGGLLGIGAGLFPNRSFALCVVCGLSAALLGLFAEWRFFSFVDDDSLGYFLTHIHQLKPTKWLMITVGGLIGFWGPFTQWRRFAKSPERNTQAQVS